MLTHGFHVPKHDFHSNSLQQEEKVQMVLPCDTQHRLPCPPPLDNTALWHTALTTLSSSTDPALWHPVPKALSSPTESLLLLLTMQLWVVLQAVVVTAWSWKLHQRAKSVNESKWPSSHSDEMSRVRIVTTRSFFCMISVWKLLYLIACTRIESRSPTCPACALSVNHNPSTFVWRVQIFLPWSWDMLRSSHLVFTHLKWGEIKNSFVSSMESQWRYLVITWVNE